jgi:LCP family protein required for cell wall assembly
MDSNARVQGPMRQWMGVKSVFRSGRTNSMVETTELAPDDVASVAPEDVLAPRSRRTKKIVLWVAGSVVVILVGSAAAFASTAAHTYTSKVTVIKNAFPLAQRVQEVVPESYAQNILLLGSDTRGAISSVAAGVLGSRSDTMMLVHIPADRKSIQVISILRDSWVDIPGNGVGKVNWALSYGALPLAIETVQNIFATKIDHVAVVDFSGFKEITEALGGVTIQNTVAFTRKGFNFPAGEITLSGEAALTYVRERKSFPAGDAQRALNQQTFVTGMLKGILSRDTLTNPSTMLSTIDSVASSLAVDEGLNVGYLTELATGFSGITASDIEFFTLPVSGSGRTGPHAYVLLDLVQLELIRTAMSDDTLDDYLANR